MQQIKTFRDQLGRKVEIPFPPERIISLCPSQTETLIALGLGEKLVGRTRFCVHPEEVVRSIPAVGGTKELKMNRLRGLKPDLVIGEKEENTREMIAEIEGEFPIFVTNVEGISSALEMVHLLGEITGEKEKGIHLSGKVESALQQIQRLPAPVRTAYLIWENPFMAAGSNTFINSMLEICGLENLFAGRDSRYPEFSLEELVVSDPELLLLSSEPFPFKAKHVQTYGSLLPNARIELVDGEMFSWYGSHLLEAPDYLNRLLHRQTKPF